ncbi:hypothetical protein [Jiangella endophytica]|uniref:hypothetical protein n=1 Tax=Jiangella endophytica TaxID=1623398 RepID=UPI0018E50C83|nr:hypothetical protein [Jiangella endophytica]
MPGYVAEGPARTWYDQRGNGDSLVLLHGGMVDGELAVVPGTSHVPTQDKPGLVNTLVLDSLTKDPVVPVRRAPAAG